MAKPGALSQRIATSMHNQHTTEEMGCLGEILVTLYRRETLDSTT